MSHLSSLSRHRSDEVARVNVDEDEFYIPPSAAPYSSSYSSWRGDSDDRGYRERSDNYRVPITDDRGIYHSSGIGERRSSYSRDVAYLHHSSEERELYGTQDRSYLPSAQNARLDSIRLTRSVPSPPSSPDTYHRYSANDSLDYRSLRKTDSSIKSGLMCDGGIDRSMNSSHDGRTSPSYSTMPSLSAVERTPPAHSRQHHAPHYNSAAYPQSSRLAALNDSTSDADSSRNETGPAGGGYSSNSRSVGGNVRSSGGGGCGTILKASAGAGGVTNRVISTKPRSGLLGLADRLTGSVECGEEVRDLTNSRWCSFFILALIILVIFFVVVAASILYYNCEYW